MQQIKKKKHKIYNGYVEMMICHYCFEFSHIGIARTAFKTWLNLNLSQYINKCDFH